MIDTYIRSFSNLRTDASPARWEATTRHRAPHKPLLLLSVMDLFAQGSIANNLIELTPDLGELFVIYWALVMPPDHRGNIALPFFHLKNDSFWHLLARPGKETFLTATRQLRSIVQLRETVLGARLDEDLFLLLKVEDTRNLLRTVLIETYFAPELQTGLVEQGVINHEAFNYSKMLLEETVETRIKETAVNRRDYRPEVRDQGFRRAIISAYDHRCASCGIRMLTADGHTAVEAAHIIPWSISKSDVPSNGMALCRLCHWVFDEGLIGVSSHYAVMTSPQLSFQNNLPGYLLTLNGRGIIGPREEHLWPDQDSLNWHRVNVFHKR